MSSAMTLHQVETPTVTPDQMELIKKTIAKDATADELKLYFHDCQRQGVHPLDRLIHFTKRGGKYTPVTSIDFMRTRAADSGDCAGIDDPVFHTEDDSKFPQTATVTVYRFTQGQKCAFTATARWTEYLPEQAFMWKKMPYTMLGKCAEALALRKAFPQQLAGLYSSEEMDQAKRVKDGESVTWENQDDKQAIVDRKLKELKKPEADSEAPELEEIEREKKVISLCVTPADFNAMIPHMKDKAQVLKMCLWTAALDAGLTFDRSLGEFVAPPPSSTPTPTPTVAGKAPSATVKANPATPAEPPALFEDDDTLTKITCYVTDVEKRKKKAGGEYWLLQVHVEGSADGDTLPVQVWDKKLFDGAQALLGKDAVLGCRRSEKGAGVYYALEQIY